MTQASICLTQVQLLSREKAFLFHLFLTFPTVTKWMRFKPPKWQNLESLIHLK